jgi:hypothetical protein
MNALQVHVMRKNEMSKKVVADCDKRKRFFSFENLHKN